MRRDQFALGDAAADRRADAEVLPQPAGGQHEAEFEYPIYLDLEDPLRRGVRDGRGGVRDAPIFAEDAVNAVDQALQCGAVELVGAAEIMHDPRLGSLGVGIPVVLGQRIIGDRRAGPVPSLGHPQIHA